MSEAGETTSELTRLRGVGPALAEKLERIGVYKPEDLLFVLPLLSSVAGILVYTIIRR